MQVHKRKLHLNARFARTRQSEGERRKKKQQKARRRAQNDFSVQKNGVWKLL